MNWTIIEPGMYLVSACAISFKPLFRMFAKALGYSDTKSTSESGQDVKKTGLSTPMEFQMQPMHTAGHNGFQRLSEDSDKNSKKMEVLITRTVDVKSGHISRVFDESKGVDGEDTKRYGLLNGKMVRI